MSIQVFKILIICLHVASSNHASRRVRTRALRRIRGECRIPSLFQPVNFNSEFFILFLPRIAPTSKCHARPEVKAASMDSTGSRRITTVKTGLHVAVEDIENFEDQGQVVALGFDRIEFGGDIGG